MPRRPRIHAPGGYFHVIQRGVERRRIFLDEQDRSWFRSLCGELVDRFDVRIFAFVLMSNHVHLAVQTGVEPLSRPMQWLFFRYASRFNRRHGRTGHLFQGRYRSLLVSTDEYAKQLIAYIHLNPVRVGLARAAGDYLHSSHNGYVRGRSPEWLSEEVGLRLFGEGTEEARSALERFVGECAGAPSSLDFKRGNNPEFDALGPDGYVREVYRRGEVTHRNARSLEQILEAVTATYGLTLEQLRAPGRQRWPAEARAMAAVLVRRYGGATLAQLGRAVQRDQSVLTHTSRRLENRVDSLPVLHRYGAVLERLEITES